MQIFEDGIIQVRAKNVNNIYNFQLDDVVGQIQLINENLSNVNIEVQNVNSWQIKTPQMTIDLQINPLKITFYQENIEVIEINSFFCDGLLYCTTLVNSQYLFGIPEHPGSYNLDDTFHDKPYRLYNLDRYCWPIGSKESLYGTAPILVTKTKDMIGGFFWRNSSETYNDVEAVDKNFDQYGIPYDVIYLDIDHCFNKRYFTFDQALYPNVDDMIKKLDQKGRKLVTIADPHILIDQDYSIYTESYNQPNFFIKNPDGVTNFVGKCWPGDCNWLDFLNQDVQKFWQNLYSYEKYKHTSRIVHAWNDMNEPAVFKGIEETMAKENLHYVKNKQTEYQVPHTFVHNLYGYCQSKATYEGILNRDSPNEQQRPLVLTRSWWVGTQKYAAIWTADSEATWNYLNVHNPMLLSFSTTGFSYCGGDVGGFEGNPENKLHIRWFQAGAFQPFFRGHSSTFCERREPWLYDDDTLQGIKNAILTRYEFLIYWYSEFYNHVKTGMPVMRALWMNYPELENIFDEEQIYMLGKNILVAPIVEENQNQVFLRNLPGLWYDYNNHYQITDTSQKHSVTDINHIPIYIRGGSVILYYNILKNKSFKSSKDIKENCSMYIVICLDEKQEAEGVFFMDDGESFKYEKGQEFCLTTFKFRENALNINVQNKYQNQYWKTNVDYIVVCGYKQLDKVMKKPHVVISQNNILIQSLNIDLNKNSNNTLFHLN
ncbi:hypothetical protein IMG5_100080 [Ichthyophthirius multifiliis]|uniref:Glucosidase II subunit alpha n=1 Tax=Ichthyophthirius multifiliis TaxID=5932 RepID=G0QSB3_ICHMU|nr:hypothetical protein IMG5_100080 [Ichthyophthirius multifiliis]EGR31860.1 hypothetical protein IMG5_100080 [Ichthyophthirius multifiliis]|eukprot:XP_004035346.1 hypothetical protein IMG5_100080 [Ichthyophthirius multifiliis]